MIGAICSENIRLTRKQITFLQEMTEEKDPEWAAEIFLVLMVDCKADPSDIGFYIDKIIPKWKERQGK